MSRRARLRKMWEATDDVSQTATVTYRTHASVLAEPGAPLIRIDRSVFLPCGCTVHIGERLDDGQTVTVGVSCGVSRRIIDRFNRMLARDATDPPTVELCARLLGKAGLHR